MTRTIPQLLAAVILTAVAAVAQTGADGEIAGRVSDAAGLPLPGVRVRISTGDESREAVTTVDGRFVVRSLPLATHRVVTDLAGFESRSAAVTLSPETRRAYVRWRLQTACLSEAVRVMFDARQAAPLVDAIVHVRVSSVDGPVLMVEGPECNRVLQQYSVVVLESAKAGVAADTTETDLQIFLRPDEAGLEPGGEYLALLWPDGEAADRLILPIQAGRVVSLAAGELAGVRVSEALEALRGWSRKRG